MTFYLINNVTKGKSSVLEAIVGDDFLPKSDDLCTWRPLNLVLKRREEKGTRICIKNDENWETLENFAQLTERILAFTDDKAGNKGNIINLPIWVQIEKEDCPEITLIDLPGIAKNPLADSEQVQHYILYDWIYSARKYWGSNQKFNITLHSHEQTIILCVVAGNVDAAASDAVKIAKKYDPEGIRTIGVCTKVDIMDKGTNAKKMLENKYVKLNLGWSAVKNRSKQEVLDGKSIKQARKEENAFFSSHEVYSTMDKNLFGIESLSHKLMVVMQKRIEEEIPRIQTQIEKKLEEATLALEKLGDEPPSSTREVCFY